MSNYQWEKPRDPRDSEWEKPGAKPSDQGPEPPPESSIVDWAWKLYLGFIIAAIAGMGVLVFGGYLPAR